MESNLGPTVSTPIVLHWGGRVYRFASMDEARAAGFVVFDYERRTSGK